ncbi:hypothetical protein V1520DRAFT_351085 [Lipomyces starkeyi]|uniref:Uncharacterized protein n=1 Tax=Lipomyces starkeyi NRRL Y-11557 TaxID=675824 RepID=A0A1E3Q6V0_LIPST|nr:hypothetical protein LIPSTDRAFT_277991 [Lipomyces starkeyi NRRL Y-11557]
MSSSDASTLRRTGSAKTARTSHLVHYRSRSNGGKRGFCDRPRSSITRCSRTAQLNIPQGYYGPLRYRDHTWADELKEAFIGLAMMHTIDIT